MGCRFNVCRGRTLPSFRLADTAENWAASVLAKAPKSFYPFTSVVVVIALLTTIMED